MKIVAFSHYSITLLSFFSLFALFNSQPSSSVSAPTPQSTTSSSSYSLSDFHSSWFWARPKEGFYFVNVGLSNFSDPSFNGASLFSVGTLNNDKSNDILTVN